MNPIDFDYFVITTQHGWRQGHAEPAWVDQQGRLSLSPQTTIPLPEKVIQHPLGLPLDCNGDPYRGSPISDRARESEIGKLIAIAFDRGNNLYLVDGETCRLYRFDDQAATLEQVMHIGGCGAQPGRFIFSPPYNNSSNDKPYCGRIAFGKSTLYVSDSFNHRVQAFYLPNFQIRFILGDGEDPGQQAFGGSQVELYQPKDILTNPKGTLYVLDAGNHRILIFNQYGVLSKVIGSDNPCSGPLRDPASMAIDSDGYLYVLDKTQRTILKFDRQGNWLRNIGSFLETTPPIRPTTIAVDSDKVIYIGDATRRSVTRIHQFDGEGQYLGYFEREGECRQLTADRAGTVHGVFGRGTQIVRFSSQEHFASQGTYFSKVLDSTIHQCQWHRIMLDAEIPEKTRLDVYFYSSDNRNDLTTIDPEAWRLVLSSPHNRFETKDALFDQAQGQYLILRFDLSGEGDRSPKIDTARIYFQRQSYLRYLPATYQEDTRGRDFLERFLSIFESMSLEIEEKIAWINQYWDVKAVDRDFLDWLASWLALINDDRWPQEKQRELLQAAFQLYKQRGTKAGLRRIIEIFTGKKAQILEHFRLRPPMVLSQGLFVGITTFVGPKPTQRLILGEESARIGEFILTDEEDQPEKPFEYDAYDFTVLADTLRLSDETQEQALRRLIEQETPAHTRYFLRTSQRAAGQLGKHSFLGVDTLLTSGYQPMRLGKNTTIGITTLLGTQYTLKGTVGIRSKIAVDAVLH